MKQLAQTGKVRYWALVISVVIHAGALAVFTGVKLSARSGDARPQPCDVSMQMIEKVIQSPVAKPKPKPKVKPVEKIVAKTEPQPSPLVAVEPQKPVDPTPVVVEPVAPVLTAAPVEFFGQRSIVRRVCYVVDCSGSMYGQMYRVKERLKSSILNLNSNHAFCVLFFTEGRRILMTGSGQLAAATPAAKSAAMELIETVRPGGSTDAAHALETAMRLRSADGGSPEVIYFLTDGFDLDEDGALQFVEKIETQRKKLAPAVVLHTIGFWPQEMDRKMLDVLAGLTGGGYKEVKD
ncbi:MAG: vWA domain-containing protein [Planctomycetota bacterium]|jgi:hypothetical protein